MKKWLKDKPEIIKELAHKFPPGEYRIKENAPYGISCEGTKVFLHSYTEEGEIGVVVMAENKLPAAIKHEIKLGKEFNKTPEEMIEIHKGNVLVYIEPQWLEKIN